VTRRALGLEEMMNKKLLIGGGAAAVLAAIAGAVLLGRGDGDAGNAVYQFETVAIDRGDVARIVTASGAVEPLEKVEVGSEVSGKIVELLVDYNSNVRRNEVLARIDPETFQTAVEQARARRLQSEASVAQARSNIERSRVNLENAEKTYARQKALFAEQAISQQSWEQAERDYKYAQLDVSNNEVALQSALAGLEQSKASLMEAELRLDRTRIRSPIDGVVINRAVNIGQTVQSSMNVAKFFTIAADLSQIQIEAAVVESDIGGVDEGDTASFSVDAFPGERFQGVVQQVRKQGTEQANVVTYTVVISARNPGGRLLPGMTANVDITADRVSDTLRVDFDATRFQPPKEIMEALRDQMRASQQGQADGRGQGPGVAASGQGQGPGMRGPGQGGPGGAGQFREMLTSAGVEEARVQRIMADMQAEMQKAMSSMPQPQQRNSGQIIGGGFGPPQGMVQQQERQERMARMLQTQEAVFRRNLSEAEYALVQKAREEMQTQRRVTVYRVNDKGGLEPHQIVIGLSDGENAQIIRGAEEGDTFVLRAVAPGADKTS